MVSGDVTSGMRAGGTVLINSSQPASAFSAILPGNFVATVDADRIAKDNSLGSKSSPIVNTTILGAVTKVLGLEFADSEKALTEAGFVDQNIEAARRGYETVVSSWLPGGARDTSFLVRKSAHGFLDLSVSNLPNTRTGDWAVSLSRLVEPSPLPLFPHPVLAETMCAGSYAARRPNATTQRPSPSFCNFALSQECAAACAQHPA